MKIGIKERLEKTNNLLIGIFLIIIGIIALTMFVHNYRVTGNTFVFISSFIELSLGASAIFLGIRRFYVFRKGTKGYKAASKENQGSRTVVKAIVRRFYITSLWGFPLFFLIVLTTNTTLFRCIMASLVMSFLSGFAAMFVPDKRKIIFVSTGILISFALSYLVVWVVRY